MPVTMFGRSAGWPAASRRCCQRRLSASPPSIAASLDPVVEQPVAASASGACQSRLSMCTQRDSISAVCGYSSLSIMFLSRHSAISRSACGSIQVVTNVATLSRALPSSISSSWMISYATSRGSSPSGSSCRGIRPSSPKIGSRASWPPVDSGPLGCFNIAISPRHLPPVTRIGPPGASPAAGERGSGRRRLTRRGWVARGPTRRPGAGRRLTRSRHARDDVDHGGPDRRRVGEGGRAGAAGDPGRAGARRRKECEAVGASVIHVHIRDDEARPTLDLGPAARTRWRRCGRRPT